MSAKRARLFGGIQSRAGYPSKRAGSRWRLCTAGGAKGQGGQEPLGLTAGAGNPGVSIPSEEAVVQADHQLLDVQFDHRGRYAKIARGRRLLGDAAEPQEIIFQL